MAAKKPSAVMDASDPDAAPTMEPPLSYAETPPPDPNAMVYMASTVVEYYGDAGSTPRGANVACWVKSSGSSWRAEIRWKPDLAAGEGGQFEMTYPNPGGGPDYVVQGRHQLQPLVDQAIKLGVEASGITALVT